MLNFLMTGQLSPKQQRFRDAFITSFAFGLTSYFCLNIERSVGSLFFGSMVKGLAVSSSIAWIAAGYFGLLAISEVALRLQGRSGTIGSKLKIISLVGGGLLVHGAYYGLLEAGFKSSFALAAGAGLTAAFTFAHSMVNWYMEPPVIQSEDITGLATPDELADVKKRQRKQPSPKSEPTPAKEDKKASAEAQLDSDDSQTVVGRPTAILPNFDSKSSDAGKDPQENAPAPAAKRKKPSSK